jgi:mono/diheme cytochrome c family protein
MRTGAIAASVVAGIVVIAAAGFTVAWEPALAPIDPPAAQAFPPEMVQRGATLAALGDCNTCHSVPNQRSFAGGLPLPTPFGTIYSTNITPDPDTGIGRWSEAAFRRAMREGVDRDGQHLYPAFPYDHFTLVSDDDNRALYAFLMTRQPVKATAPANQLPFPLNIRASVAGWKLLFLQRGPFVPDPAHDEVWNRGAYLVNGVGHCGACHTPRNLFGAEKRGATFAGGEAEGWHAFSINAGSTASVAWDADSLNAYLRQGWHGLHGVARGPMAPVAGNLASVPDQDVKAIAVYVASVMNRGGSAAPDDKAEAARANATGAKPQSAGSQTVPAASSSDPGAAIYASACAICHDSGRPVPFGGISLVFSTVISADSPRNLINILLGGVPAADGVRGPVMPGFSATLNDDQIAALAGYLRQQYGHKPAWPDVAQELRGARANQLALNASEAQTAVTAKQERP